MALLASVVACTMVVPEAPAQRLVIEGATIIDMVSPASGAPPTDMAQPANAAHPTPRTIVIENGRIAAILAPGEHRFVPGETLLRAHGLFVMPGLVDAGPGPVDIADLRLMALDGVTTVVTDDVELACRAAAIDAATPRRLPRVILADDRSRARAAPDAEDAPRSVSLFTHLASADPAALRDRPDAEERLALIDPDVAARWRQWAPVDPDEAARWRKAHAQARRARAQELRAVADQDASLLRPASGAMRPFVAPDDAMALEIEALVQPTDSERGVLPLEAALRAATRGNAEAAGLADVGRLEVGAVADLLILEEDPRLDPSALRRVRAVVLRGELLYRSEREAIRSILKELRASQASAFSVPPAAPAPHSDAAPDQVPDWPDNRPEAELPASPPDWPAELVAWRGSFLWLLDGLPRGAERAVVRRLQDTYELFAQREFWTPLRSRTVVRSLHALDGRLLAASLRFDSPVGAFEARVALADGGWSVSLESDGQVSTTMVADMAGDGLLMLGPLPSPVELRALVQAASPRGGTAMVAGHELLYGEGPVSLVEVRLRLRVLPEELATIVAGPPNGPRPGSVGGSPGGRNGALRSASGAQPAPDVGRLRAKGLLACEGVGRAVLLLDERSQPPTEIALLQVDEAGWPAAGRWADPHGLWEVRPLSRPSPTEPDHPPSPAGVRHEPFEP